MKKQRNKFTGASALQIMLSIALILISAIFFASRFNGAPIIGSGSAPEKLKPHSRPTVVASVNPAPPERDEYFQALQDRQERQDRQNPTGMASPKHLRTLSFGERVAYQYAIEEVYWRHRIWPKENASAKPSLDKVMPQAAIEKKVEDYLRDSQALEDYWQRPITSEQLQAEMERMASHTKQADVLREIFAVLGNDPFVIAECLAGPILAERLVSELTHGTGDGESATWKSDARTPRTPKDSVRKPEDVILFREALGVRMRPRAALALLPSVTRISLNAPDEAGATNLDNAAYKLPEISVPLDCTDDTWTPTSLTNAPSARFLHTAVWTGSEMIVWGGGSSFNTGGRYDPSTDSWTATSTTNAPSGRGYHTAVWTGTQMIVWGGIDSSGYTNTGGRYDPGIDSWTATSTTNAPSVRYRHTAVWTGNEMIVWGGGIETDALAYTSSGGRYNPTTNSWTATSTTNAPGGRILHTTVWTGSEMIVWGGFFGSTPYLNTGGRYNPSTNSWAATSTTNAPSGRYGHAAVWIGSEMIVWGGDIIGGRYNPGTDSWTATSTTNAPSARTYPTAVWTGTQMIVWGGSGSSYLNTGGRYNPGTDSWTATSTASAPSGRYLHKAVWTGNEMIVWGGSPDGFGGLNTGGRYCAQPPPTPTPTPTATASPTPTPTPQPSPTLGNYPNTSVQLSANTTIVPDAPPANTIRLTVSSSPNYNGKLDGDPGTGIVRVTDPLPAGTYAVTVRAFNSAMASTTKQFTLTVTPPVPCKPVSFALAGNAVVGNSPNSVAIGDFNGDGRQDFAVVNLGSNNVSILLGNGKGGLSAATNFVVGIEPISVAVGDFNGDGKQDLAVANHDSSNVSILLGNGLGGFSAATNFAAGTGSWSVAVGDFNGDGKQDLAVANLNSNNVSILLGDGMGGFSPPSNFGAGNVPRSIALADFNDDGKQDIAVANFNSYTVSILLGDGMGGFSPATHFGVSVESFSVAVGDFNGDGKQDLATANWVSDNVSILLGNGMGGFSAATNFGVGHTPRSVAVGDFNGDGKQDLAVANSGSPNVSILLGNGMGGFSAATNFGVGGGAYSVAVGDFNGDGRQDLAVANGSNNLSILLSDCPATTPTPTPTPMPTPTPAPPVVQQVSLPSAITNVFVTDFSAPVTSSDIDPNIHGRLQAFQGDFTFDSTVIDFQNPPVETAGLTTTGSWSIAGSVLGSGPIKTLRVSCFSANNSALDSQGQGTQPLFNLRMIRLGTGGQNTALVWAAPPNNFYFVNDQLQSRPPVSTPPGSVNIVGTTTISGTVTYCVGASRPVPYVSLNLTGSMMASASTDNTGAYTLAPIPLGGNYTVTPAGLRDLIPVTDPHPDAADPLQVQQHFQSGGTLLTGCAELAAHAVGNSTVTIADALAIQQFFLNMPLAPNNLTGKWRFIPAQRNYMSLSGTQPNQDYTAYIIGDVTGEAVFPTPPPLGPAEAMKTASAKTARRDFPQVVNPKPVAMVSFSEQSLATTASGESIIAVIVSNIDPAIHGQLQAFQGDLTFDSTVMNFQSPAVQTAGLTSEGNWSLMANVLGTGRMKTLRVSCFSLNGGSLSGEGTLFELRMMQVSSDKSVARTELAWLAAPNNFIFFDADLQQRAPLSTPPGRIIVQEGRNR